ncbi:MAG: exo-alpha-sialidase [Spirochaetes bacterium]|nr:MAG: exo-alpha-sialidase [Spirochaetota bacterium]
MKSKMRAIGRNISGIIMTTVMITLVTCGGGGGGGADDSGDLPPDLQIYGSTPFQEWIPNNGTVDICNVELTRSQNFHFDLNNYSKDPVNLTGTPLVEISGPDADLFVVTTQPHTPVIDGDYNNEATITFTPLTLGEKTATVTIQSDDPDTSVFTFTIKGHGSSFKTVDSVGSVGRESSIALNGNNVYLSYYDDTNYDLKFGKSIDSGVSWNKSVISTDCDRDKTAIRVNGSDVYICYKYSTLKFAKSTDGGATWPAANKKTIDSTGITGVSLSMANNGSSLYVSYVTNGADFDELRFAKSTDGGTTWASSDMKLITVSYLLFHTSISVSGNNVAITYLDHETGYLKCALSADNGNTWSLATVDNSVGIYLTEMSVAVNGNNVFISYYNDTDKCLRFAKSTDFGTSWSAKTIKAGVSFVPYAVIGANSNSIYVLYYQGGIHLAKSNDSGATWELSLIHLVSAYDLSITVTADEHLGVSYFCNTPADLISGLSLDGGATW